MLAEEGLPLADPDRPQPRFEAEVAVELEHMDGGNVLVQVRLENVKERRLSRQLEAEDQKHVKDIAKKDPLSLIQFWSIDDNFDGEIFRPSQAFVRTKGDLPIKTEMLLKEKPGRIICVKLSDVMGQVYYHTHML